MEVTSAIREGWWHVWMFILVWSGVKWNLSTGSRCYESNIRGVRAQTQDADPLFVHVTLQQRLGYSSWRRVGTKRVITLCGVFAQGIFATANNYCPRGKSASMRFLNYINKTLDLDFPVFFPVTTICPRIITAASEKETPTAFGGLREDGKRVIKMITRNLLYKAWKFKIQMHHTHAKIRYAQHTSSLYMRDSSA